MTIRELDELHEKVQALQDQYYALLDPWVNGGPDLSPEQWEQVRLVEVELRPLRADLDRRMTELMG